MFTNIIKTKKTRLIAIATVLIVLICNIIPVCIEKYYCQQMHEAIEENDMEKLRSALQKGNPNSVLGIQLIDYLMIEFSRETPLQTACLKGDFEMVKLFVESGADVNYHPISCDGSALYFAVKSDSPEKLDIVRYLIKNGATVARTQGPNPLNALSFDFEFTPDEMEILRELVAAGASVNSRHFWDACYMEAEEAIRFYIEETGLDVADPYCIRCYCGMMDDYSYEILESLLQRGANPYAKDEDGKCAMDHLREKSPEWAEKLEALAKEYGFEE